ncbi:hypothetical protein V6N13_067316 [Hibiscus sabdariffa]
MLLKLWHVWEMLGTLVYLKFYDLNVSTESYMAAYCSFMGEVVLQSVQWKGSAGEEATVQSRYKTTRFQGDNRQNNRGWRNPRGRQRTNFAYDQPSIRHSGMR